MLFEFPLGTDRFHPILVQRAKHYIVKGAKYASVGAQLMLALT